LLALSAAFFIITYSLLNVRILEPRFLLAFVIPFLVWIAEFTDSMQRGMVRFAAGGLTLLLLVGGPLMNAPELFHSLTLKFAKYDEFISESKKRTGPISKNCFTFSGKSDLAGWAREFYFREARDNTTHCLHAYHLHFDAETWPEDYIAAPEKIVEPLYKNEVGMALYKLN